MGLRNRQRIRPNSRAALDRHNHHSPGVTYADPELAGARRHQREDEEREEARQSMQSRERSHARE